MPGTFSLRIVMPPYKNDLSESHRSSPPRALRSFDIAPRRRSSCGCRPRKLYVGPHFYSTIVPGTRSGIPFVDALLTSGRHDSRAICTILNGVSV